MVLTFIATIVAKGLSEKLQSTKYRIQPTLTNLATQSITNIQGTLITSEPNKSTRLAYEAVGVDYPVCIKQLGELRINLLLARDPLHNNQPSLRYQQY